MANSITGINDDLIAQSVLHGFTSGMTPIRAFGTDFNSDAVRRGEKISVPRDNTAIDAALTKVTHTAYTISDCDSDAVEISLGQPVYVSWGLDDVEIASSSVLNMEMYGMRKGNKLAATVLAAIWSQITNANYGAAAFTGAAGTFDADDIADIKNTCDTADMPKMGRSLVLSSAYYNALLKDANIQASDAFGSTEALWQGRVPRLMGFDLYESTLIPDNSENLVGFACVPEAMVVAMRYLQPQEGNTYLRAEPFSDPDSGIVLGLRDYYTDSTGVRARIMECVYGYNVGIAAGLKRIVSA